MPTSAPIPSSIDHRRPAVGLADALARLAGGPDAAAWAMLLERAGDEIRRLAFRITGDVALADDALQETLLRLREDAGGFTSRGPDPDGDAWRWIMRVAMNTAAQLARSRRRATRRRRGLIEVAAAPARASGDALERVERDALLRDCLGELDERFRHALVLHVMEGASLEQVAAAQRVPIGTAKSRISRGLDRLRRRLGRSGLALAPLLLSGALRDLGAAEAASLPTTTRPGSSALQALLTTRRRPIVRPLTRKGWPMAVASVSIVAVALLAGTVGILAAAERQDAGEAFPPSVAAAPVEAAPFDIAALGGTWGVDMAVQRPLIERTLATQVAAMRRALPPGAALDEQAGERLREATIAALEHLRVTFDPKSLRMSTERDGRTVTQAFRIKRATVAGSTLTLRVEMPPDKRRRTPIAGLADDEADVIVTRRPDGIHLRVDAQEMALVRKE